MKKSELYRMAQEAVVIVPGIKIADKLDILRELMKEEDLALFVEQQKGESE